MARPIVSTPGICSGSPRIRGTRVSVHKIVVAFMDGWSWTYIAHRYGITVDEATAAIRYQMRTQRRK
jgi:uncharacterized protein (DUF433 family)